MVPQLKFSGVSHREGKRWYARYVHKANKLGSLPGMLNRVGQWFFSCRENMD